MSKKNVDIKYELIPYDDFIGSKEFDIDKTIYDLNSQMELLSNQADNLDYFVAIASGIACGLLDILWVGEFNLANGRSVASDKVDAFVKKTAEMLEGEKFDDVKSAVKALEKRFPIPSDGNTPDFGGGLQHHLRDFAHHPTIVGLAFSLLTQFTEKSYGTDANGVFLIVDVLEKSKPFIGKDVPQKILRGTITWFFHLVSDVAGSSSTAGVTGGTGIPGPILALAKEVSAIPFFKNIKVKGMNYLDVIDGFEKAGFVNVTTDVKYDIVIGWLTDDGEVKSVSINGDKKFDSDDEYRLDAEVVITYHTWKKNRFK